MISSALVTGGAGFIGSHIVEALVAQGVEVRVLDDLSSGRLDNLRHLDGQITVVQGDVRDPVTVRECCSGVDTVFHLAAFISVPGSVEDPETADDINIGGTRTVLLAARNAGVRRVVFSSSAAVYGEPAELPVRETARTLPGSPYGLEKLYGEHLCRLFTELYDLETVALRYFNVYGPRQSPTSEYAAVIPKFAARMLAGERATIYGDGTQTRDFLYVGDVARANLLAATSSKAVGRVMNVASGVSVTILELHSMMAHLCGSDTAPLHDRPRPGDILHSVADTSLARDLIGFRASTPLADGLKMTLGALRDVAQA